MGPIETVVSRHPDVLACAAYGVPDPEAGDRVMVALVLRPGAAFDPAGFASWIDGQADLSPKWRPTHVRVAESLPVSPTNKVLTRTLVHEKYRTDRTGDDALWFRDRATTCSVRSGRMTPTCCVDAWTSSGAAGSGTCDRGTDDVGRLRDRRRRRVAWPPGPGQPAK